MRRILLSSTLVLATIFAVAQDDELFGEIEKLDKGQLETKSAVPEDPTLSAEEIENELNEEFGIAAPKKQQQPEEPEIVAPDELPEEIVGSQEDEVPVVEETTSPAEKSIDEEFDMEDEPQQKAQDFTPVPAPEPIQDTYEEDEAFANEPIVEEPPQPIVEEPAYEEPPAPVVEETPRYEEPVPSYADVPDDFEERMHRIYSRFYTEATSDSVWTQIAGEKINETYTIQRGDTLWDISVTFFGNGHYWPKVWQMNDNITNPHLIAPGYVLKFVPGQINQAPQLNITSNEDASGTPVAGTKELGATTEDPGGGDPVPVIPPPEKKSVPVLTELPPSLPYIKGPRTDGFDKDGFDIQNQKPKIQEPLVYVSSYLSEEQPYHVGKIVEMNDEGDSTATLYDTVFVQMRNGATIGERLTVYSIGEKVSDAKGSFMGYPVVQEGEIQIQELVNSKEDVYKAIVVRSISSARIGSLLMRSPLVVSNTKETKLSTPINAQVVGGRGDNDRKILGYQDIVYLNKGANDGVREGQVFTVLKQISSRKKYSLVEDMKEQIAKVKIVKTTPGRATAIVLNSREYVRAGDFIGTPTQLPGPNEVRKENSSTVDESEFTDEDLDFEQE